MTNVTTHLYHRLDQPAHSPSDVFALAEKLLLALYFYEATGQVKGALARELAGPEARLAVAGEHSNVA